MFAIITFCSLSLTAPTTTTSINPGRMLSWSCNRYNVLQAQLNLDVYSVCASIQYPYTCIQIYYTVHTKYMYEYVYSIQEFQYFQLQFDNVPHEPELVPFAQLQGRCAGNRVRASQSLWSVAYSCSQCSARSSL